MLARSCWLVTVDWALLEHRKPEFPRRAMYGTRVFQAAGEALMTEKSMYMVGQAERYLKSIKKPSILNKWDWVAYIGADIEAVGEVVTVASTVSSGSTTGSRQESVIANSCHNYRSRFRSFSGWVSQKPEGLVPSIDYASRPMGNISQIRRYPHFVFYILNLIASALTS